MGLFPELVLPGIVATLAMTAFLYLVNAVSGVNSDMVRAIGTLFTREDKSSAAAIGFLLHLVAGSLIAVGYQYVWSLFPFLEIADFLRVGALMGFAHGLSFSILLVILVAEYHPIPRFRKTGVQVAFTHGIAHIIYGIVLGYMASVMQNSYGTAENLGILFK